MHCSPTRSCSAALWTMRHFPARSRHPTAIGCAAALLQVALGLPLAWSLGDDRLTTMSAVLALSLPLVGAAGPVQGMLTRDRAYRKLAWRTLTGQGLGTLVGVVSALAGAGAWALVAQQLVISTAAPSRCCCAVRCGRASW